MAKPIEATEPVYREDARRLLESLKDVASPEVIAQRRKESRGRLVRYTRVPEPHDWPFLRHFVLWTKYWYPSLGKDPVEAMRVIISEVSGTELGYVGVADTVGFIVGAFHSLVPPQAAGRAMREACSTAWFVASECMNILIKAMVNELRHTYKDQLPPLGEPDLGYHLEWMRWRRDSEEDREEDLAGRRADWPPCRTGDDCGACHSCENYYWLSIIRDLQLLTQ